MASVLIPKAAREQLRWQKALNETGIRALWADPWCIERLPLDGAIRTQWMNLDLFTGVICVSPTAADALVEGLDAYWPMPPSGVHWLCNGPRTAEVLNSVGLPVTFPVQGHTAEDVLALAETQTQTGDKWLIVKGEGGRVTLQQTLQGRGAEATELVVYRRSVDQAVLQQMATLSTQADALWLSSAYLGQQLWSNAPEIWSGWSGEWWVSSPRLARWCEQQGISNIRIASGATVDSLQTLIREAAST